MDNTSELDDENFSFWNFNSVVNFYKDKHFQIFLFLLVFVIIYVVDHISNINAMIFAMPSAIPGVPSIKPGKRTKK
jgi:hypothetical protein